MRTGPKKDCKYAKYGNKGRMKWQKQAHKMCFNSCVDFFLVFIFILGSMSSFI